MNIDTLFIPQGLLIHEKTRVQKSHATLPLTVIHHCSFYYPIILPIRSIERNLCATIMLNGLGGTYAETLSRRFSRAQLTAYLVNDDDDRRALTRVLDDVYAGGDRHKPRIFTSLFIYRNHNVQRPPTTEPVLMDYIQVPQ